MNRIEKALAGHKIESKEGEVITKQTYDKIKKQMFREIEDQLKYALKNNWTDVMWYNFAQHFNQGSEASAIPYIARHLGWRK